MHLSNQYVCTLLTGEFWHVAYMWAPQIFSALCLNIQAGSLDFIQSSPVTLISRSLACSASVSPPTSESKIGNSRVPRCWSHIPSETIPAALTVSLFHCCRYACLCTASLKLLVRVLPKGTLGLCQQCPLAASPLSPLSFWPVWSHLPLCLSARVSEAELPER